MDNNLNILVEAKKEYTEQLSLLMCPLMIQTFLDLYEESYQMAKGRQALKQYQKLLKEVPNWNNHIVKQHTQKLSDCCSWFSDLLAAVFVSNVKILSSVRLNSHNKKIQIKLPSNEVFIHGCYVSAAKELYKNPFIYHEDNTDHARDTELIPRFKVCIESTIKDMIPVQQILQTYISQGESMEDKQIDFDNEPQDTADPDVNEGGEEEEPEPEPEPESEPEEPKNIPVTSSLLTPSSATPSPAEKSETPIEQSEDVGDDDGDDDDGVLFPRAPE